MKRWQETTQILERLAQFAEAGQPAALATVVRIAGSAYRRPGAKFLIAAEGSTLGGISGGCLEEDVRQNGLLVIENGDCRLLHYETGDDDDALWGLGLGCDGAVDVFVQPAGGEAFNEAMSKACAALAGTEKFALATVVGGAGLSDGAAAADATDPRGQLLVITGATGGGSSSDGANGSGPLDATILDAAAGCLASATTAVVAGGDTEVFVEVFEPPSTLVVCGAGDDTIPMVAAASTVGFRVVVVDHRPAYLTAARFPTAWMRIAAKPDDELEDLALTDDTFVVLKTHNLVRDKAWARRFIGSPVPYVGLLGPRARCEEIAAESPEAQGHRVFGPVGLDLGAEGPEQVGVAIVAELLAVRAGRAPGHLKDRQAPIHD